MITVLGKLADTQEYLGQPGYNVSAKSKDWTPANGREWVREAVQRGDQFLLVSNPADGWYAQELGWLIVFLGWGK